MVGVPTDRERIVKLEVLQEQQGQLNEDMLGRLDSIDAKLDQFVQQLARTKGFVGGVIFTVTSLGAAIGWGANALWDHFSSR